MSKGSRSRSPYTIMAVLVIVIADAIAIAGFVALTFMQGMVDNHTTPREDLNTFALTLIEHRWLVFVPCALQMLIGFAIFKSRRGSRGLISLAMLPSLVTVVMVLAAMVLLLRPLYGFES